MAKPKTSEIPLTIQEQKFFAAIDRILEGKPKHKDLQPTALAKKGKKLKLDMTTLHLEAGFARTYLYKNRDAMARVHERFRSLIEPSKPVSTARDLIEALRKENAILRHERNTAIDVARRHIQAKLKADSDLQAKDQTIKRLVDQLNKSGNKDAVVVDIAMGKHPNG